MQGHDEVFESDVLALGMPTQPVGPHDQDMGTLGTYPKVTGGTTCNTHTHTGIGVMTNHSCTVHNYNT